MKRSILLAILLAGLLALSSGILRADLVETADGESYAGEVSFGENGTIRIVPAGGTGEVREFDWSGIRRLERKGAVAGGTETPSTLEGGTGLPAPWKSVDVGKLEKAGRSHFAGDAFVLEASPPAEEGAFDAFHFVYQPLGESGEIVARIATIEAGDGDSGAGIILLDGLDENARKVQLLLSSGRGATMRFWQKQGGSSVGDRREEVRPPYWLKLVRLNEEVVASISPDGKEWKRLWYTEDRFEGATFAGLVATAADGDDLKKAVIDKVRVGVAGVKEGDVQDPRIHLVNGSSLIAPIESGDDTAIKLGGWLEGTSISTVNVARIEFNYPVSYPLDEYEEEGRFGVLTRRGDFLEGDLKGMTNRRVDMSSVLFGIQQFAMSREAQVLLLRKVKKLPEAPFGIKLGNGSAISALDLSSKADQIMISMFPPGSLPLAVPASMIEEIVRTVDPRHSRDE